jgi:hypothetical protein
MSGTKTEAQTRAGLMAVALKARAKRRDEDVEHSHEEA